MCPKYARGHAGPLSPSDTVSFRLLSAAVGRGIAPRVAVACSGHEPGHCWSGEASIVKHLPQTPPLAPPPPPPLPLSSCSGGRKGRSPVGLYKQGIICGRAGPPACVPRRPRPLQLHFTSCSGAPLASEGADAVRGRLATTSQWTGRGSAPEQSAAADAGRLQRSLPRQTTQSCLGDAG